MFIAFLKDFGKKACKNLQTLLKKIGDGVV
jgi:hypothetical protein